MKIIKRKSGAMYLKEGETVVGEAVWLETEEGSSEGDFLYLERIDIYEEHMRKGYGTKALHEIRKSYGSFYVAPDNECSKRLFERIGEEMDSHKYGEIGYAFDQGFGVYEI